MKESVDMPIYSKIALDVANRISRGEFREGQKINGRSTLAGEYNVSPETIRRAMNLLEDMQVVTISQGSGIHIKSRGNAVKYIERFRNRETIGSLRNDIHLLIEQKKGLEEQITATLDKIIEYADRLKHVNPFTPVEVDIPDACPLIGKTVSESKFWQNTGATIIAIRRGDRIILSPGPYARFEKKDCLIAIGDAGVLERIRDYIGD